MHLVSYLVTVFDATSSSKHVQLSLHEKVKILDFCKNNRNLEFHMLTEMFHLGETYIANIMSYKENIYKT